MHYGNINNDRYILWPLSCTFVIGIKNVRVYKIKWEQYYGNIIFELNALHFDIRFKHIKRVMIT